MLTAVCTLLTAAAVCGAVSSSKALTSGSAYLSTDLPVANLDFYETFDEKTGGLFTSGKWTRSNNPKYSMQPVMVKKALNSPLEFEGDKGLQLTQEMKHYGLGTMLHTPFVPGGRDIVLQYEMKVDAHTCGGAYLKFLRSADDLDLTQLDNNTPFSVMFGPDKCGADVNKVHFIIQHQSPITGEWEEKHYSNPPRVPNDKMTHLYTLAIDAATDSFKIYLDKNEVSSGSLLTDMSPPINPPFEVDDPSDHKPVGWVDDKMIPDPDAIKPDDWDESQPMMIPDESKSMPSGWREDWPVMVPDPAAQAPEDWDDEEDGQWEAPEVPNPACEAVPGCGPWTRPVKKNPEYKGKWIPPIIKNPAYIGEWTPRQIPNPNYFEEPHPSHLAPIAAVVVEVWTTNAGFHYDNIIIAHNLNDAWNFADASFIVKRDAEMKKQDEDDAAELAKAERERILNGGIKGFVEVYVQKFISYCESSPHLNSVFNRLVQFFQQSGAIEAGLLTEEQVQFVERNATSIIIGFTVLAMIVFVFVLCACILPTTLALDDNEEGYEQEVEDLRKAAESSDSLSPISGKESTYAGETEKKKEEVVASNLRQRNTGLASSGAAADEIIRKSSPVKKKSRKDD